MPTEHAISVDDDTVSAVHHVADTDRWLIFCHGFLSDKTGSYEARAERAVAEGYNAVRFDFRGSGDSDGAFADATLTSRIGDLLAVLDRFDPPSYALFGSSFGAMVAFHATAGRDRVDPVAVVARSPVTYTRAFDPYRRTVEAEGVLRYDDDHAIDSRFFDDFDTYSFEDVAAALSIPIMIAHGGNDDSVPIADSFDAAAALDIDVVFLKYAEEGHRFSAAAERRLRDRAFDWLDDAFGTDA